jgi:glycosyltransferase involved in cell wall biosynthesis
MRIAQIMLAKGLGGAERSFIDLTLALAARGHQLLALGDRQGLALPLLAGHPKIECVGVRCLGSWDLYARRTLRTHLQHFAPDVVQAHLARAACLGGRAAHDLGLPTLAKTHNLVQVKYYRDIDALVPTTTAQAAHLHAHGVAPRALHLIPNFSALQAVAAIKQTAGPPWCIKSAGRFVPKKGYAALLTAFAQLRSKGMDARLVIGGDGPEAARLKTLAQRLNLLQAVEFPGWIDNVADFLADADLFVLPSHDEPFGIVVLEAMASGVPIVTTPTVGPSEILDHQSACFAAHDDAPSLAVAIENTLADYDAARSRANAALSLFRHRYSSEVVVARYLALYAELVAQQAERRQA